MDRTKLFPWALGAFALIAALALNLVTGLYVDGIGATLTPSRDLLHELLPRYDLPVVHVWGFVSFSAVLLVGVAFFERRERVPFLLWAYALLVATRAVFTTLTPIGVPLDAPSFEHYPVRGLFQYFDFRHTMFFSGHTALPFLAFLLCRAAWVRWASLGFSLMLATSVLLSRLHYTIDVAAAFFIAYGVSRAAERSFAWLAPTPVAAPAAPVAASPG